MLKPVEAGHHHEKRGFFGWFNRGFTRTANGYESLVAQHPAAAPARFLVIYAALIVAVVVLLFLRLPTSFLPQRGPGLHDRQRAAAAGRDAGPHAAR